MTRRCAILVAALTAAPAAISAQEEMDDAIFHFTLVEVDAGRVEGEDFGAWHAEGWIGTDFDRLWWSTEGAAPGWDVEDAEFTLLYGRYVRRFWDLVVGYRQDLRSVEQAYLTAGIMGLAPWWFEVGAFAYLSQEGRPSLRLEAETDLYLTQRWVLTPEAELDWLPLDDDRRGLPTGLADVEAGMRTRYEIRRKLAPYLDFRWVRERIRGPLDVVLTDSGFRIAAGLRIIY